jgi:acyl-CoA thioesterase
VTKFDEETALDRRGPGEFEGRISPDWSIVRGANGGHIAAILLRGMINVVGDPAREPRSLTVHFARVPKNETFTIQAAVEREGRTMSNVTARFVQDDKVVALAMAAFSTPRTGPSFDDLSMPEVAPPGTITAVPKRPDFPFGDHFEFLRALGPEMGDLSDKAEIGVWMRMSPPQVVDHLVATQLMDAFAPAVFAKLGVGGGGAGVPTVEMTYHFRSSLPLAEARPDTWYLAVFRTTTARDGFIEEDGWLWSEDGTLVAQSRQLAIVGFS